MIKIQNDNDLRILKVTTLILVGICLLGLVLSLITGFEYTGALMQVLIGLSLAYLVASWRFYDPILADEMGVRDILGKPLDRVDSGPTFAPLGFVGIERYPTATVQEEFPGETSKLFFPREGESETPPPGSDLVTPLRITFAGKPLTEDEARKLFGPYHTVHLKQTPEQIAQNQPKQTIEFMQGDITETKDGLANSRITAVVSHISRFRIFDPIRFTIAVSPTENGSRLKEVARQIEDEQIIALNTILTQLTVDQATRNMAWINAVLFQKVCHRIRANEDGHSDEWGIDLEGAAVKPFQFNRALNSAITSNAQAAFDAVTTVRNAEAAKQAKILLGEGDARAARDLEKATLEGRADGLARIAELARTPQGQAALATDVARAVADGGNTIVVGTDGVKDIIGLAAAASKISKPK